MIKEIKKREVSRFAMILGGGDEQCSGGELMHDGSVDCLLRDKHVMRQTE